MLVLLLARCAPPLPSDRGIAFVLTNEPDQVFVIDLQEGEIIKRFLAGDFLADMDLLPGGQRALITSLVTQQIALVDLRTARVLRRFVLEGFPSELVVHPSGKKAYLLIGRTQDVLAEGVTILDLEKGEVAGLIPTHPLTNRLVLHPDGRWLYVGAAKSLEIRIVDTETDTVSEDRKIILPNSPSWFTVTPDGKYLLFVFNLTDTLYVVDARTLQPVASIQVASGPFYVEASADGRYAYVSDLKSRAIIVVDLQQMAPVRTVYLDVPPVVLRAGKRYLYAGTVGNFFFLVDPQAGKPIKGIPLGAEVKAITLLRPDLS